MKKQKCIKCGKLINNDNYGNQDGLLCVSCCNIAVDSMLKQSPLNLKMQDIKNLFSARRIGNHTGRVSENGRAFRRSAISFKNKYCHSLKT